MLRNSPNGNWHPLKQTLKLYGTDLCLTDQIKDEFQIRAGFFRQSIVSRQLRPESRILEKASIRSGDKIRVILLALINVHRHNVSVAKEAFI